MNDENMHDNASELLRKFAKLPRRYKDIELLIEFENSGHFHKASMRECRAFNLSVGETIVDYSVPILPENRQHIYAQKDIAERIIDWPVGALVNAKVRTIHALGHQGVLVIDLL